MKVRKILVTLATALLAALLLAGCGGTDKEVQGPKTEEPEKKTEEVKTEPVKETQKEPVTVNDYTTEDGMYTLSIPGEWTEEDNMGMCSILNLSGSGSSTVVAMGITKAQAANSSIGSLQDFYDFAESSFLNGEAATTTLSAVEPIPLSGFADTLAQEGTMTQSNGASGDLFVQCMESEQAFYMIMLTAASGYDEMITSMRENMRFEELDVPVTEPLSDTLSWFNATYALITRLNGGNLDFVAGYEPSDMMKQLEQSLLERDWGVTDKASLDETIDWALTEGHNAEALFTLTDIGAEGMSREEIVTAMDENGFDEEDQAMILAAFDAKAAYGENAIAGWDLSRAMSLMGWGYLAEYYTYEEAMDKSLETAQRIQQTFGSWDEFFDSYLLGYSYWSGQSMDDPDTQAYERRALYEELKADPDGIFSVDWNTPLEKEW